MMLENQKQIQYENNFTYENISNSSLPPIENLTGNSSQHITSTSANYHSYKYWNPATNGEVPSHSQAQVKQEPSDQLIGELK